MDSSDLLPSLAQGELAEVGAIALVAAIRRAHASGTLSIQLDAHTEVRQFFRAGAMCGSAYFYGFRTLAQMLLESEWASVIDVDASLAEAQASGKRHGQVLLERGLLNPQQLSQALVGQHRRNLSALLRLESGRYELRGTEPPPAWTRELHIDTLSVLLDALERDPVAARKTRAVEWLGDRAARLAPDWLANVGRLPLAATDRLAAALLAVPRSLAEFTQLAHLVPARAEALFTLLILVGAVDPQETGFQLQPPTAARDGLGAPPASSEPSGGPASWMLSPESDPGRAHAPLPPNVGHEQERRSAASEIAPSADFLHSPGDEPIEETIETAQPLPEEPLWPPPSTPSPAEPSWPPTPVAPVKPLPAAPAQPPPAPTPPPLPQSAPQALQSSAGRWPGPGPGEADVRDDVRRRLRARGLRNLIAHPTPLASEPPEPEPAPAAEIAPPPEEPMPPALSTEQDRFVEEVMARARKVHEQDAWQRLGLTRDATTEQIRAAYLEGVKRYHPDRAGAPGLASIQPELRTLFTSIKEAYDLIADANDRAAYQVELVRSAGGASQSRRAEATLALRMGEVLLKRRDFAGAIEKLRRSVEIVPSSDSLAALAWALLCDPANPAASREEAEQLIEESLAASEPTARAHYVAGVLLRSGESEKAAAAFRKALELDPSHAEASLELRVLEMRQTKKKDGGGLFGKRK